MTSIEWLIKELYTEMNMSGDGRVFDEILEEAKEMHKQEIIDAAERWKGTDFAERYYQETFVSKGSDDTLKDYHIVDTNKMVELPKQDVDKFEKFLDNEIELGLSPKDTIERIKWYYKTYFKQPKKD